MPLYTYRCTRCYRRQEELRPVHQRNLMLACTTCNYSAELIMSPVCRPRFGTGVKGHTSREANTLVRSKPRGTNDGYEG